jgi:asparagine synthase (glutamine-hydrolysing)
LDHRVDYGADFSNPGFVDELIALLDDAVRLRMIADVPVGAFLSGGIDSSMVARLMARHTDMPVKTFSLGFSSDARMELPDAKLVADHLGTEHFELNINKLDLPALLSKLVYHFDEPFADAAAIPLYLLSRFAREHVKVVLTGDGGDELFGGYKRYAIDRFSGPYRALPGVLTGHLIPALFSRVPQLRRAEYLLPILRTANPQERVIAWLTRFNSSMQSELLNPDLQQSIMNHDPADTHRRHYAAARTGSNDSLNSWMYAETKTLLVDGYLEKTDKATMACGIEARVPLLDHRIVELAFRIPSNLKVNGRSTKMLLRTAAARLLPAQAVRKPKRGFFVPTGKWLREDLRSFASDILFEARTRQRGYFNQAFVERLWREHIEGHHVWTEQLWILLMFELWNRTFIDGFDAIREPLERRVAL